MRRCAFFDLLAAGRRTIAVGRLAHASWVDDMCGTPRTVVRRGFGPGWCYPYADMQRLLIVGAAAVVAGGLFLALRPDDDNDTTAPSTTTTTTTTTPTVTEPSVPPPPWPRNYRRRRPRCASSSVTASLSAVSVASRSGRAAASS